MPFRDEGNEVLIGNELANIRVSKVTYNNVMQQSHNASTFLLKFLSEKAGVYTNEELLRRNWNGGVVRVNGDGTEIVKESLMKDVRFKALLAQAARNWPGQTEGLYFKPLVEVINNKCRKSKSRIAVAAARTANAVHH